MQYDTAELIDLKMNPKVTFVTLVVLINLTNNILKHQLKKDKIQLFSFT